jgi:hypothetical protein
MVIILPSVGCPLCESLNVVEPSNEIGCRCLECGFEYNNYDSAEE